MTSSRRTVVAFSLLFGLIGVYSRPDSDHIDCRLWSVTKPGEGLLTGRSEVMGGAMSYHSGEPLGELELAGSSWYALTINDMSGGFVVYTNDGELRVDQRGSSGSSLEADENACSGWNDIIYNSKPGDIVGWKPRNDNSVLTLLHSNGYSGGLQYMEYTKEDTITPAPVATPTTPAPVATPTTPAPVATPTTPAPVTPPPVDDVQTDAPTAADTENTSSPTTEVDQGGAGVEDIAQKTNDTIFRITIAALTLLYMNFLWQVIQPLQMLGVHH